MIISHKHKFIFFRTRKTAGTSLEIALSEFCGKEDIIPPVSKKEEEIRRELGFLGPQNYRLPYSSYNSRDWARLIGAGFHKKFYDHIPAVTAKRYLSKEIWDTYYKFTFERNPWDKAISYYFWRSKQKDMTGFDEFITNGTANISDFEIYSINGIPVVDDVFSYEDLDESLKELTEKLGLKKPIHMPEKKVKGNIRKNRRPYQELISETPRKLIEVAAAREIKLLGYQFEVK